MQDLRSLDQELQESSFKSGNSVSKSKLVHLVHHLRVLMLEGIKEDVVLSPGHVRSFITAGERNCWICSCSLSGYLVGNTSPNVSAISSFQGPVDQVRADTLPTDMAIHREVNDFIEEIMSKFPHEKEGIVKFYREY
ncbi:hypothetical protein FXO37_19167 [Capsicum annuum]|nr:hypothetical protein FXO37_19167 [Capsicum annuum]